MSDRDEFAKAAMQGMVSGPMDTGLVATRAYTMADAMLAARGEREHKQFDVAAHLTATCASALKRAEDAEAELSAANAKLSEMARLAEDTQREVKTLTQDLVAANLTIDHMRRGMPQAQVKETDDA